MIADSGAIAVVGGSATLTPGDLAGLAITAPPNSSADFTLGVTATATDVASGSTATATETLAVSVAGVADAPNVDLDSSLAGNQLVGTAVGDEDTAIPLDISASLADLDGSESLKVIISDIPEGAVLTVFGFAVTANRVEFNINSPSALNGITITPPEDSDEDFSLTITAISAEAENDSTAEVQGTINLVVNADADDPELDVSGATANSPAFLDIDSALTDIDGSEVLTITIADIPEGAEFGNQAGPIPVIEGSATITAAEATGLYVTPAPGAEGSFTLSVTATATEADGDQAAATRDLVVTISPPTGEAPVVTVTAGSNALALEAWPPAFPDVAERQSLEADEINGIEPQLLAMPSADPVTVTFISEGAGYKNTLGWYTIGANGEIGEAKLVWDNASAQGSGGALVPGQSSVVLDGLEAGQQIGFFVVANGFNANGGFDGLDLAAGTLEFRDATDGPATVFDAAPTLHFVPGDGGEPVQLNGSIFHTTTGPDTVDLNPDGIEHVVSGTHDGALRIGFEDLTGGGDLDFQDLIVSLDIPVPEVTRLAAAAVDPSLTITDADGNMMSGAVVAITAGFAGDALRLDPNLLPTTDGVIDGTGIVVSGEGTTSLTLEGTASAAEYEAILRAVQIANENDNPDTGAREIAFSVTDSAGIDSALAAVNFVVTDPATLGTSASDSLQRAPEGDVLSTLDGADSLRGDAGDDILFGGAGDDRLDGGRGDDQLFGEAGDDRLIGRDGTDILVGGSGDDVIDGGGHADELYGGIGSDVLRGGRGDDVLSGEAGDDSLRGGRGDDALAGGAGDDTLRGDRGDDVLTGGSGDDTLRGGRGGDVLTGGAGDDSLRGDRGDDILTGGAGDDSLRGDRGDDILVGGAGSDVLSGGRGDDALTGGAGCRRRLGRTDRCGEQLRQHVLRATGAH